MEINYKLDRDELIDFFIEHVKETKNFSRICTKRILIIWGVLNIFFLILFGIIIWINGISIEFFKVVIASEEGRRSIIDLLGKFLIFDFLVLGIYLLLARWNIKKTITRLFNDKSVEYIYENRTVIVNEEELHSIGSCETVINKLENIKYICEIDDFLLIYNKNTSGIVIPVNAFDSSELKEEFIKYILDRTDAIKLNNLPREFEVIVG